MSNLYATLAEYKSYSTPRGQTIDTDAVDDLLVMQILEQASRSIDTDCARTFYPRYETRYFDVPVYQNSPRLLFLDDDLLEVKHIINGDLNEVLSTVYNLKPKNYSPHYAIQIIGPTSIFWIFNRIGNIEKVISVEGWWGFHNKYDQRAWSQIGTLSAAITDTTSLSMTLNAGHTLTSDRIIKIDDEIMNVANLTALSIESSTNTTPIQITTTAAHGLTNGAQVIISGHLLNTNANGTWVMTYVSTTEFTLNGSVGNAVGGNTGSISSSTLTETFTVNQRGDNGSTAATHLDDAPVYQWNVQPEIVQDCLQRTEKLYMEKLGVMVKSENRVKYADPDLTGFVRTT